MCKRWASWDGDSPPWMSKTLAGLADVGDVVPQAFAHWTQLAFDVANELLIGHALGMFCFFGFAQEKSARDLRTRGRRFYLRCARVERFDRRCG
jgi:hypothetical protein